MNQDIAFTKWWFKKREKYSNNNTGQVLLSYEHKTSQWHTNLRMT